MRKLIFHMNVSLDGFADHTVSVADDELHDYFTHTFDDFDAELLGRKTYELMAAYWPRVREDPDATESMKRFGDKFNAMPKIVFSRTLEQAEWNNTRLVRENAAEETIALKNQPGKDLSLGGIETCREFMKLGLVDEFVILVHPVLAGKGRRLFEEPGEARALKLLDTRTFRSGVAVLHYAFAGPKS